MVIDAYDPSRIFAPKSRADLPLPRVFTAPQRYVQGQQVFANIGRYLALVPAKRVALLMSQRGIRTQGVQITQGLRAEGIEYVSCTFGGECSREEISVHARALEKQYVECVIGSGGGKCIDAAKAIASRLDVPVVIAPTLASNDAPCSAVSILYSPHGAPDGVEFYPTNPALVVVDTQIVARASERYLVAGIGDAMATWYEARVCMQNPTAVTTLGARPTIAASAIGRACAETLFERGAAAAAAVANNTVNDSLESVVEANTLLSGLGFESGGLAAAHGVANGLASLPSVESQSLHGEMVAMGTLTQLILESRPTEATRVARFFTTIGLPTHLAQLSLDAKDHQSLDRIAESTLAFPFIKNLPVELNPKKIVSALQQANTLGLQIIEDLGDRAFLRLHTEQGLKG
jgi:glycerol dehydrogenase